MILRRFRVWWNEKSPPTLRDLYPWTNGETLLRVFIVVGLALLFLLGALASGGESGADWWRDR